MRTTTHAATLFAALILSANASAQHTIFKCMDERTGHVSYSTVPCHGNDVGFPIRVRENSLDTSGAREQAMRREIESMREEARSLQRQQAASDTPSHAEPRRNHNESRECAAARRSYYLESSSLSSTRSTIEAKRSAMYVACGMAEPDRVEVVNETVVNRVIPNDPPLTRPGWRGHADRCSEMAGMVTCR